MSILGAVLFGGYVAIQVTVLALAVGLPVYDTLIRH